MFYNEYKPCLQLSKYIDCYWVLEISDNKGVSDIQKIHPYGFSELIIHYYDNFEEQKSENQFVKKEKILITGQLTKSKFFRSTGKTGIIAIRFKPEGVFAFTKINANEFKNISLEASVIWNIKDLEKIISIELNINEKIKILENWLLINLRKDNGFRKFDYIKKAVEEIRKYPREVNLLHKKFNVSERTFERNFQRVVGVNPKKFARITRFNKALVSFSLGKNIQDIIFENDYYDQSHLIHEFKEFYNSTPLNLKMTDFYNS